MTALRVLVVDDEAPARMRLVSLLAQCRDPFALCVGEATQATAALAAARELQPDVALLDIGLPGPSGLQLAQALREQAPQVAVVFVTAHAEHAVHAFELDAVDYLTKPVRAERLEAALRRVVQRRATPPQTEAASAALGRGPADLVVQERGQIVRVPVAELLYLRAERKYITLRTAHRAHLMDATLSELEPQLGRAFLRVHRNALVAVIAMAALERRDVAPGVKGSEVEGGDEGDGWMVQVRPVGEWLAVSRRQLASVRAAMKGPLA